jgi:hypothetical protein
VVFDGWEAGGVSGECQDVTGGRENVTVGGDCGIM